MIKPRTDQNIVFSILLVVGVAFFTIGGFVSGIVAFTVGCAYRQGRLG